MRVALFSGLRYLGFPKIGGVYFGVHFNMDYNLFGSIVGTLFLRKLQFEEVTPALVLLETPIQDLPLAVEGF